MLLVTVYRRFFAAADPHGARLDCGGGCCEVSIVGLELDYHDQVDMHGFVEAVAAEKADTSDWPPS
jgi:hypothetical protein